MACQSHSLRLRHQEARPLELRVSWLWVGACMCALLYGSLLPLDLDLSRLTSSTALGISNITWHATTTEDVVTNVLVYLPLGVLVFLAGTRGADRRGGRILLAAALAGILSLTAETLQTCMTIRAASWADVVLNVGGAGLGALLAGPAMAILLQARSHLRHRLGNHPFTTITGGLALGLMLASLAPFDFVTSTGGLHEAFRRASWSLSGAAAGGEPAPGVLLDMTVGAAWFALLGYVAALAQRESGWRPSRAFLVAAARGTILVVLIEALQLFTHSHVFEVSDLLLRTVGVHLGAVAAIYVVDVPTVSRWQLRPRIALPSRLLAAVAAAEVLVLLTPTLASAAPISPADPVVTATVWPFELLWRSSMATAAYQVAATLARYGILALVLSRIMQRLRWPCTWPLTALLAGGIALLATVAGPVLIHAGAPDLTDPLLALLAVALAARVQMLLQRAPQVAKVP